MKLPFCKWLLVFCIMAPHFSAAQIKHSYRFYANLSVSPPECGPDLTQVQAPGGCGAGASPGSYTLDYISVCGLTRTVYHNNMHWGLRYDNSAGAVTNTYTIHMYVKNTDWGTHTWARIIDFSNGQNDAGIYYKSDGSSGNRCLDFYPSGIVGACPYFSLGTYYLLTFTRNGATNTIDVYVNNFLFTSYNDAAGRYTGTTGTPIYIYRDDQSVTCESGEANFAYLSFTNVYSNQHIVDSVYNSICTIANAASADFQLNPTLSCNYPENIQVTYTGTIPVPGAGYAFNWNWDGGTVVSGSGMGPYVISWPTPGVKHVTLSIQNTSCGTSISNTQQVTLSPKNVTNINQTICQGGAYAGYTATGTYTDTFHFATRCDSIRILNLTVMPPVTSTVNQTICQGQSYQGHNTTGTYTDTYSTAAGCDSIRTLNLTVTPAITSTVNQSICQGQSYQGHNTTGTYTDTYTTSGGCDSIRTLHLTVNPKSLTTINQTICTGQSYLGYTAGGTYRDTFQNVYGCDSIRTLTLTVVADPVPQLGNDRSFCTGDSIVLEPGVFNSYSWQDGSTSNVYIVRHTGLYIVTVAGNCGTQSDNVFITEQPCVISFPSVFTPNGDGLNETFGILNAPALQSYQLTVYNRWGQRVFQSDKASLAWNGKYNDQLQPNGAYTWYCIYTKNNQVKRVKGTVALVR